MTQVAPPVVRDRRAPDAGRAAGSGRTAARAATFFGFAALAIALAILLIHAARPYAAWPNRSDDFFYYLLLVRESLAHGVVSVDGVRPTNGFHPLYFLALRALLPVVGEEALPNAALMMLAIAHAGACVMLWLVLRRLAGAALAGVLLGLYAANPHVLRIVFAAVETPLMVLCLSVWLWAHLRWREGRGGRAPALAALALAVAARTDVVWLAFALAIAPAVRRVRTEGAAALRALDPAPLAAAGLPVLVFGIWGLVATGEFVQTSGRALSMWQSAHDWRLIHDALAGLGALRTPATAVVYGLEVVGQWIACLLRAPWETLGAHPAGWVLLGSMLVAIRARRRGAASAAPAASATSAAPAHSRLLGELLLFQLALWTFYALLFRHGQLWYWHGSIFVWAAIAAIVVGSWGALAWLERLRARLTSPAALVALTVVGLIATWISLARVHPRPPSGSPGTAAAVRNPLSLVADGAVLGAFDSGELGWQEPRLTVVNLDGLVNNAAYRALRARRIGAYMRDEGIEWLYAHDGVVRRFRPFGLDAWLEHAQPVARSASGVVLYRMPPAVP